MLLNLEFRRVLALVRVALEFLLKYFPCLELLRWPSWRLLIVSWSVQLLLLALSCLLAFIFIWTAFFSCVEVVLVKIWRVIFRLIRRLGLILFDRRQFDLFGQLNYLVAFGAAYSIDHLLSALRALVVLTLKLEFLFAVPALWK
jgi:hypothetical protein